MAIHNLNLSQIGLTTLFCRSQEVANYRPSVAESIHDHTSSWTHTRTPQLWRKSMLEDEYASTPMKSSYQLTLSSIARARCSGPGWSTRLLLSVVLEQPAKSIQ